jgi:hypothetical protein
MSISDIPFEFSKLFIQQKNYSKQKLLSCILYILSPKDTYMYNVLDSLSKNPNLGDEKILIFTLANYLYSIAMNAYTIVFKKNVPSKLVSEYFKDHTPSIQLFGESLTNLAIGVLLTECLDLVTKINNNKLALFGLELYDIVENLYNEQFNILADEFINNNDDTKEAELINKYDNALNVFKLNILKYMETYGNNSIKDEFKSKLITDLDNLIKNIHE